MVSGSVVKARQHFRFPMGSEVMWSGWAHWELAVNRQWSQHGVNESTDRAEKVGMHVDRTLLSCVEYSSTALNASHVFWRFLWIEHLDSISQRLRSYPNSKICFLLSTP